jgi:hypothetical protein
MHYVMRHSSLRYTTPRRALVAGILFLLPVPWVVLDLLESIEEYRTVQTWSVCSEPQPTCLDPDEVTFDGPYGERRSALRDWNAAGGDDDAFDTFDLQPGFDNYAETLPGPGVVYRVDGEIVAVAKAGSTTYAPTAMSGSHAITLDIFLLLMLLGLFVSGVRTSNAGLRAGLAWADKVPVRVLRGRRVDNAILFVGAVGTFATFNLAKGGVAAWVLTGLIGAAVLLYPFAKQLVRTVMRFIRQRRGVGRHAA